jgi:hypothetical protein
MPSQTIAGGLLAISSKDDQAPWNWTVWMKRTGVEVAPFSDSASTTLPNGWTPSTVNAVRTFAENFWCKSPADRIDYIRRQVDNNSEGRNAWITWVQNSWDKEWKINNLINLQLDEHRIHPYALMKHLNQTKVNETNMQFYRIIF